MEEDSKTPEHEEIDSPSAPSDEGAGSASLAEKFSSLLKDPANDKRNARLHGDEKVIYPNAKVLTRPLDLPQNVRIGIIVAVIAAAIIGFVFLGWYLDGVVNEPKRQQQAVTEALESSESYDLPNLYSLMPLDNADILSTLQESGLTIYEMPAKEGSSLYHVVKLPANVNVVDAGTMYLSGVENLNPADAARLLNGSWDLQVNRENGTNMVLHYADFKSGNVDAAVQSALTAEGLNEANIEESGEDNAGNTYVTGTISGDAGTYSWRVSALPLSEIYSVNGLPENAVYVGIRMTS